MSEHGPRVGEVRLESNLPLELLAVGGNWAFVRMPDRGGNAHPFSRRIEEWLALPLRPEHPAPDWRELVRELVEALANLTVNAEAQSKAREMLAKARETLRDSYSSEAHP